MATVAGGKQAEFLRTLPTDDIREIMWGFAERLDLQMVVQSTRTVARGTVARLVAGGARNTHEWTEEKAAMLKEFDGAGITAVFMDPEQGGYLEGPKNLALALIAFELAWVDAGAATCSLAGCWRWPPSMSAAPPNSKPDYMSLCVPPGSGKDRQPWRGALLPYRADSVCGWTPASWAYQAARGEWADGKEPLLHAWRSAAGSSPTWDLRTS
jgi:hypothetical protein